MQLDVLRLTNIKGSKIVSIDDDTRRSVCRDGIFQSVRIGSILVSDLQGLFKGQGTNFEPQVHRPLHARRSWRPRLDPECLKSRFEGALRGAGLRQVLIERQYLNSENRIGNQEEFSILQRGQGRLMGCRYWHSVADRVDEYRRFQALKRNFAQLVDAVRLKPREDVSRHSLLQRHRHAALVERSSCLVVDLLRLACAKGKQRIGVAHQRECRQKPFPRAIPGIGKQVSLAIKSEVGNSLRFGHRGNIGPIKPMESGWTDPDAASFQQAAGLGEGSTGNRFNRNIRHRGLLGGTSEFASSNCPIGRFAAVTDRGTFLVVAGPPRGQISHVVVWLRCFGSSIAAAKPSFRMLP